MTQSIARSFVTLGVTALIASCGSGGGSGGGGAMRIEEASNGFGRLLPHTVFEATPQGLPSSNLLEVVNKGVLFSNVTQSNPIRPVTQWPTVAQLPNGDAGNHFLYVQFRRAIDIDTVMDAAVGAAVNDSLTGAITVLAVDPVAGTTTPIRGRAFVGGFTYGKVDVDNPGRLRLERWIGPRDGLDSPPLALEVDDYATPPGTGFPGTESVTGFAGANVLASDRAFVFVPDIDDDLSTFETFPTGVQVRMRITSAVRSTSGQELQEEGLASSTVGDDTVAPEVSISGAAQTPTIVPGNGDVDVDPSTRIFVEFTEPVQPLTIGPFDNGAPPLPSSAITVLFGPDTATVTVPFHAEPISVFDLSRYELKPAYNFPGAAPQGLDLSLSCGSFSEVEVRVNSDQVSDLVLDTPNRNQLTPSTSFSTGEGPGLVNAPVTPDAIYVGRQSPDASISVIDLNGFGASTGDPTYDLTMPLSPVGTNYPNNPNVSLQGSVLQPQLGPGSCTFDGGSAGVYTLTKDSSLDDRLIRSPLIFSVADMALGHALDNAFNASQPFGCQSGGGNLCAASGLKNIVVLPGGANTVSPVGPPPPFKQVIGGENTVSWAPHPNPPPLVFPPLCLSPLIGGAEPTSFDSSLVLANLLSPGANVLGNVALGTPPSNLLADEQHTFFQGPSLPQQNIANCSPYMIRQQIGNFLYVADRIAQQIVVLNSNRFTVLERIPVADPTKLAMSPNLGFLAVSSQGSNSVFFIDTDPNSATFHEVVNIVAVGTGPTGIAWESGNEDIHVCNTTESSVTIISGFTLTVRKTIIAQLNRPFEVALTPRQGVFGFQRGVYFGYYMNADGRVSIFESGPSGVNGIGFDTIIGQPQYAFNNAKAMQPDVTSLNSGIWVCHENQIDIASDSGAISGLGGGAISKMVMFSGTVGVIPIDPGFFVDPQIRDIQFRVIASIGSDVLTGVPVDLAFDNLRNLGVMDNWQTQFSPSVSINNNGKSIVKVVQATPRLASAPHYLFAAVPNSNQGQGVGAVDVIDILSGFQRVDTNIFQPGVNSIPVAQPRVMMDYFRQ
ncbi:MAG: beta-propeller fold lactonase family protein [Planctomycetota bacterium]